MQKILKRLKNWRNLEQQTTVWEGGSEEADVAEGNADDFFHERFARRDRVDVDWKFAFAPVVQVG